jgi:hypothetical protein
MEHIQSVRRRPFLLRRRRTFARADRNYEQTGGEEGLVDIDNEPSTRSAMTGAKHGVVSSPRSSSSSQVQHDRSLTEPDSEERGPFFLILSVGPEHSTSFGPSQDRSSCCSMLLFWGDGTLCYCGKGAVGVWRRALRWLAPVREPNRV